MVANDNKKTKIDLWYKVIVITIVIITIASIFIYKNYVAKQIPERKQQVNQNQKLPKLIELGAETCPACQIMKPILKELKKEYEGRIIIEIIDINERPEEVGKYNIRVIPTQILFDANGKEVGRHEGFISKEDLIKAFKQVGVR